MYMEETESSFMTEAECLGCQSALLTYYSNSTSLPRYDACMKVKLHPNVGGAN